MSGKIVQQVLDNAPEDLTDTQMFVLLVLAEDARDNTRVATHSGVKVIAHRARRAEGTVKNTLSALVQRGLIQPLHDAHRGRVQHYRIAQLYPYHRKPNTPREDTA